MTNTCICFFVSNCLLNSQYLSIILLWLSYYCTCYGLAILGNIQHLGLCIVPPSSRANILTSLELNISPYCPPARSCNNIYNYIVLIIYTHLYNYCLSLLVVIGVSLIVLWIVYKNVLWVVLLPMYISWDHCMIFSLF